MLCINTRLCGDGCGGGRADTCFAVYAELCGRRDALCGRGGADPRDVRGKALEHRHDLFRRRLQCDDDPGRLAGLNRARFRSDSM